MAIVDDDKMDDITDKIINLYFPETLHEESDSTTRNNTINTINPKKFKMNYFGDEPAIIKINKLLILGNNY